MRLIAGPAFVDVDLFLLIHSPEFLTDSNPLDFDVGIDRRELVHDVVERKPVRISRNEIPQGRAETRKLI